MSEQVTSKPMSIEEMRDLADCCPQRCHEALLWGAAEIERLRAALEYTIRTEIVDNDGNPIPETGMAFIARGALRGAEETKP